MSTTCYLVPGTGTAVQVPPGTWYHHSAVVSFSGLPTFDLMHLLLTQQQAICLVLACLLSFATAVSVRADC